MNKQKRKSDLLDSIDSPTEAGEQLRTHQCVPLDVVLTTAELGRRPSRLPDYEAENHAFGSLLKEMADSPKDVLELLVNEHASGMEETAQMMLTRIQASAEFMDQLLLSLLAYARTASIPLDIAAVEPEKAWAVALLQCETQVKTIGASVQRDLTLPTVRADQAALGQILTNLLSNALKFVPPGVQPQIHLRAANYGENARLWVEDNGIGIAPEYHERIFRLFERLNGSSHPGTGVGLSIVRKGVERMGGKAGVESEPGKGSRFWIELPKAI